MAKTLPKPVVSAIELAIQIAHSKGKMPDLVAIAAIYDTTYESCSRIRRRLIKFEHTGVDDRKKAGPKPLKGADELQITNFIRKLLHEKPDLDQKSISAALLGEFGVVLGQSTVSRLIKRGGIPHKQSNRWYTKTRLVSTHPEGHIMPLVGEDEEVLGEEREEGGEEDDMRIAANALSQMPGLLLMQGEEEVYRSPYAMPDAIRDTAQGNEGVHIYDNRNYLDGYS